MKQNKGFHQSYLLSYFILLFLLAVNTFILAFVNIQLMLISLFITLLGAGLVVAHVVNLQRSYKNFVTALQTAAEQESPSLQNFDLPVVYVSENDEILWYNNKFEMQLKSSDCYGKNAYETLGLNKESFLEKRSGEIKFNNKEFSVYFTEVNAMESSVKLLYLVENTSLKRAAREYVASRPVVMIIATDNFSEIMRNCKDSEKTSFRSAIHKEIENWLSNINCISINRNDKYIFVLTDERSLNKLSAKKFDVLDSVRKLKSDNYGGVTLSIGVGKGGRDLSECEYFCRQGLEMAQSRGGDQVAIKSTGNEYEFFGGISAVVERRSTIRARVLSSAIFEMINASDNILLMGHKYSDLDCLGSAYALAKASMSMGKDTFVVINDKCTMASALYKRIIAEDTNCRFTNGDDIENLINDKTLLIVLDTHRAGVLENIDVYHKCKNVIVIDHHRKSVDAIDKAVVFYHETAASSASEMVTELLQYMPNYQPDELVSDALMSGIMLDTKNFCLHTGVRTFEASAYLKRCGADPIKVKGRFSDNFETYSRKSAIVSKAEIYGNSAISFDEKEDEITRIATSQAADELLNFEKIKASFVMCKISDGINISARSYGEVNVQLIMEALGGGGHRNMAACQLQTRDFEIAKNALKGAIDNYNKNINFETEC